MAPLRRSDVPQEQVWDLTHIFADDAAFDEAIQKLNRARKPLSDHAKTLGDSEAALLSYLRDRDVVMEQIQRIGAYAMLSFSEDGADSRNQTLMAKAQSVSVSLMEELTRLQNAYLALPFETQKAYASSTGELSTYREHLLEMVHMHEHKLSPEAESALAALGEALDAPSTIYRTATGADLACGTVPDESGEEFLVTPFSIMVRAETSIDADFRKRAYDALIKGLSLHHNTLGATLATEIKKNVALSRLRGYSSTADMLLHDSSGGFPSDNVDVAFFERVPELLLKQLSPHMQRYARLRAKVWGLPKLRFCDVKAPVIDTSNEKIPFAKAQSLILDAVAVMGPDHQEIVRRAFTEKWIYRGDNIGALQGAYCEFVPDAHPYVFDPFHGILYDLFTLIHELGHAAHGVYMHANQVAQNRITSRLFVEAPSTFHEHLLARHLRQTGDDETRLRTNCAQLFSLHHNFVTHLIEGELLRRLYRMADADEPITTAVLDRTQLEILQEFWGDTVELDPKVDPGASWTWMRQSHYYMGLYPYTYSVGLTASTALARRLLQGEDVTGKWIEVQKMGGSLHALDLFRAVGIEMDSETPYREAAEYVAHLIDELETALG